MHYTIHHRNVLSYSSLSFIWRVVDFHRCIVHDMLQFDFHCRVHWSPWTDLRRGAHYRYVCRWDPFDNASLRFVIYFVHQSSRVVRDHQRRPSNRDSSKVKLREKSTRVGSEWEKYDRRSGRRGVWGRCTTIMIRIYRCMSSCVSSNSSHSTPFDCNWAQLAVWIQQLEDGKVNNSITHTQPMTRVWLLTVLLTITVCDVVCVCVCDVSPTLLLILLHSVGSWVCGQKSLTHPPHASTTREKQTIIQHEQEENGYHKHSCLWGRNNVNGLDETSLEKTATEKVIYWREYNGL